MQRTIIIFAVAAGISVFTLFIPIARAGETIVNCNSAGPNGKIATVLSRLDPAATNVVRVKGHCKENIVIQNFSRLSLMAERGAVIEDASNGQLPVVEIWYSPYVLIQGFTIQGGQNGLFCRAFSFCRFIGDTVEQTKAGAGILIGSAEARMEDITVRYTANTGIQLVQAKVSAPSVSISDTGGVGLLMDNASYYGPLTIQRAGTDGVNAQNTSHLTANLTVTDSGGNGVVVTGASSANMSVTVTGSGGNGVVVTGASNANMSGAVTGSGGSGVFVTGASSVTMSGSVTDNGGDGFSLQTGSAADISGLVARNAIAGIELGGTALIHGATVTDNKNHGISVQNGGVTLLETTVSNNGLAGVMIMDVAFAAFIAPGAAGTNGPVTISGNLGGSITCGHQAAYARGIESVVGYAGTNCPVPAPLP